MSERTQMKLDGLKEAYSDAIKQLFLVMRQNIVNGRSRPDAVQDAIAKFSNGLKDLDRAHDLAMAEANRGA